MLDISQQARLGWRVQNATEAEADIDIFDVIGDPWFGTMASDFVKDLRAITAKKINLHINSPGGYVNDALAMFAAIQQHPAEVTALIESEAASAASFVAMAADKVVIFKNAKMFIHEAQGFGLGNAQDFRTLADLLDGESENIASIYAEKSGGTVSGWRDAMKANDGVGSTYRGQEAVDVGLADEVWDKPTKTMPMHDRTPMRVAAQHAPIQDEPSEIDTEAIAEAMNAAKLEAPAPTLESLLGKYSLKEAVAGAAPGGK